MPENKAVLIFSGFNQRAIVAFLRTLKKLDVSFFIFAKNSEDQILLSDYKNNVVWVKDELELNLRPILKRIQALKDKYAVQRLLIAPSAEYLNRFLLKHRTEFEAIGCIVPLVDEILYERISDKKSFTELCKEKGLTVPAEYKASNINNLPLVAKPKTYFSGNGNIYSPILLHSPDDLKSFQEKQNTDDFYFQEFINGRSYYLLMYFDTKGTSHRFSQENLVQQGNGKSVILAKSSDFHLSAEATPFIQMLKDIDFSGFIMIEVIKKENQYYVIEANPRFWGPSQLLLDSDNNFFELMLFDYGFIKAQPEMNNMASGIVYYWSGGFEEDKQNNIATYFYDNTFSADQCEQLFKAQDVYNKPDTLNIYNL